MSYRYYLGLSLPPALRQHISDIQQQFFDPSVAREPLEPHITLLPPPSVAHLAPDQLATQAAQCSAPFLPLQLTLHAVETFDKRAVVISVESPSLVKLQAQLAALLPKDDQPHYFPLQSFHPHITLNQAIPGGKLPDSLIDAYHTALDDSLPATYSVDRLTMFHWVKPRRYRAESI